MQLSARIRRVEGALVLMYHSVADDGMARWIDPRNHVPAMVFEEQARFLSQKRSVIHLSSLLTMVRDDHTPPSGSVVITFDDGYLDNLQVAAPILQKHNLPATVFLPTGSIDRGETQWVDQAYTAFKYRRSQRLGWGQDPRDMFDLTSPEELARAHRAVCLSLLRATPLQRRMLLHDLMEVLQPLEGPPRLTMTWNDVRNLTTEYGCFQIGGHTREHTDLTSVSDVEAKSELDGCASRIKETTGYRPRLFSFPYGRTSRHLRQIVAKAGYEMAFGGDGADPIVTPRTDLYAMPRVVAPASMRHFDMISSSANSGIWRRLGR